MRKMQILCLPGTRMRESNPFTALLAEGLMGEGARIEDFTLKGAVLGKFDAIIIHWPDHFSSQGPLPVAILRTVALMTVLTWQRVRGAKIVRVVHDVSALFPRRKWLRSLNRSAMFHLVTGYLFLSQSSETAFRAQFPKAAARESKRLFHPRFQETVSPALLSGTQTPRTKAVHYVGDIKPYKGLHTFLAQITQSPLPAPLNIFGRCEEAEYHTQVEAAIETAQAAGNTIIWTDRRPSAEEFTQRVSEASLLVLPYLDGWNSGMALSALEAGTPILSTDLPIFEELSTDIGDNWITTYNAQSDNLSGMIADRLSTPPSPAAQKALSAYLQALNWDRFSQELHAMLTQHTTPSPLTSDTPPTPQTESEPTLSGH